MKGLIQQGCDFMVFKRFFFHHMTPVTCGITNREKDRFIFFFGFFKSLQTPRLPVNGVYLYVEGDKGFFHILEGSNGFKLSKKDLGLVHKH